MKKRKKERKIPKSLQMKVDQLNYAYLYRKGGA